MVIKKPTHLFIFCWKKYFMTQTADLLWPKETTDFPAPQKMALNILVYI